MLQYSQLCVIFWPKFFLSPGVRGTYTNRRACRLNLRPCFIDPRGRNIYTRGGTASLPAFLCNELRGCKRERERERERALIDVARALRAPVNYAPLDMEITFRAIGRRCRCRSFARSPRVSSSSRELVTSSLSLSLLLARCGVCRYIDSYVWVYNDSPRALERIACRSTATTWIRCTRARARKRGRNAMEIYRGAYSAGCTVYIYSVYYSSEKEREKEKSRVLRR